jgi:hypothetical protein
MAVDGTVEATEDRASVASASDCATTLDSARGAGDEYRPRKESPKPNPTNATIPMELYVRSLSML